MEETSAAAVAVGKGEVAAVDLAPVAAVAVATAAGGVFEHW